MGVGGGGGGGGGLAQGSNMFHNALSNTDYTQINGKMTIYTSKPGKYEKHSSQYAPSEG
jgi:hypothetical protein